MKILKLADLPLKPRNDAMKVKGVHKIETEDKVISFGNVVYPAGVRNPAEGVKGHNGIEVTLFLRGGIQLITQDQTYDIKAGEVTVADYGEAHASYNNTKEDCETFYIMIADKE